jgi:hypothetical protein
VVGTSVQCPGERVAFFVARLLAGAQFSQFRSIQIVHEPHGTSQRVPQKTLGDGESDPEQVFQRYNLTSPGE